MNCLRYCKESSKTDFKDIARHRIFIDLLKQTNKNKYSFIITESPSR